MRFDQTGEVLHYIERFHAEIAGAYAELAGSVTDRRTRMLLEYMSSREQEAADSVHKFWHGSRDRSLKEWDPFTIDDSGIRQRLREGLKPAATTDELLGLGIEIGSWFEELFRTLEGKSGTPEQKALFANMRERTDREKHKLARNANMLLDF
jgi:hypothetical protein